jgi:hypothetical protein
MSRGLREVGWLPSLDMSKNKNLSKDVEVLHFYPIHNHPKTV